MIFRQLISLVLNRESQKLTRKSSLNSPTRCLTMTTSPHMTTLIVHGIVQELLTHKYTPHRMTLVLNPATNSPEIRRSYSLASLALMEVRQ